MNITAARKNILTEKKEPGRLMVNNIITLEEMEFVWIFVFVASLHVLKCPIEVSVVPSRSKIYRIIESFPLQNILFQLTVRERSN